MPKNMEWNLGSKVDLNMALDLLSYSEDLGNGMDQWQVSKPIEELNFKDGYTYNDPINGGDGLWYEIPPAPVLGQFDWENPAPFEKQTELNEYREIWINYNLEHIYRAKLNEKYGIEIEPLKPDDPRTISELLEKFSIFVVEEIKEWSGKQYSNIKLSVSDFFLGAVNWTPPRDPLTLDLDGDGIETLGTEAGVLFDHNANGMKQGTGWVSPDDGLLAFDRNGNGTIDDGTELFGDNTILSNGSIASDGFEAIADLDTNSDGVVDALDGQFSSLRVWRDLNSDGISQSNELARLDEMGISAISVHSHAAGTDQANGNTITRVGEFIRSSGSKGKAGALDLAVDAFHREFTEKIEISGAVALLPNMRGSGVLRDLHEAASLNGDLAGLLQNYAVSPTRAEQMAVIDELLAKWVSTAEGFKTSNETMSFSDVIISWRFGSTGGHASFSKSIDSTSTSYQGDGELWMRKIEILEHFNGRPFIDFSRDVSQSTGVSVSGGSGGDGGGGGAILAPTLYSIIISDEQLDLLQKSYGELTRSVYEGLSLQTRLKPFIDAIGLTMVEGELSLDFSQMEALVSEGVARDTVNGLVDALDLKGILETHQLGWEAHPFISSILEQYPIILSTLGNELQSDNSTYMIGTLEANTYTANDGDNILLGGGGDDSLNGNNGNDFVVGGYGNDNLYGGAGNDTLQGGVGEDMLYGDGGADVLVGGEGADQLDGGQGLDIYRGGAGDDLLGGGDQSTDYWGNTYSGGMHWGNEYEGGTGNDTLRGTRYADTYSFNPGDGQDLIEENGPGGYTDTLRFGEGINHDQLWFSRKDQQLVLGFTAKGGAVKAGGWQNAYARPSRATCQCDGCLRSSCCR